VVLVLTEAHAMKWSYAAALAAAILLIFDVAEALAWGPAVHAGIAHSVLGQMALIPAGVAAILAKHRLSYIYGNIAADVVFAKRMSRVKQFCHHWSTGFSLLEAAEDDGDKAFAYGYLSHLAADTVAHGKYVPRQIATFDNSVNFGHFYWELRADSTVEEPRWRLLKRVLVTDHDQHHTLMKPFMAPALLRYGMNRALFESMNHLCTRRPFRRGVGLWGSMSRSELDPSMILAYRDECVDRVISLLSAGPKSQLLREDPNGNAALMQAKFQRRKTIVPMPSARRIARSAAYAREAGMSLAPLERERGDEVNQPSTP
jgi:hypothetical protein